MKIIIYIIDKKPLFKHFPSITHKKMKKKKYILEFEDKLDKLLKGKNRELYL